MESPRTTASLPPPTKTTCPHRWVLAGLPFTPEEHAPRLRLLDRVGQPEEIAQASAWLASDGHAQVLHTLPWHHRDPFDRLIIAQAIAENLDVMTADAVFAQYPVTVV